MKSRSLILSLICLLSSAAWAQESEDFSRAGRRLIEGAKQFFTGCENRFAGSAGNILAAERVAERFAAAPYSGRLPYETAVFVPGEAHLTIASRQIALQPLLPNNADPCLMPSPAYEGKIVYGGQGEIEEIEGKPLAGALVLFEFDCGFRYLEAVKRGAAACIFIAPARFTPAEAYAKVLAIPLSIPRFQVAREEADFLRHAAVAGQRGVLRSSAGRWERRELANLWALVEGAEPERRREMVVLYANLDSMHYAPNLASGGAEALNLYLLLEIFDACRRRPPPRSVLFGVFNSSHQYHAGAAEAVYHLFGREEEIFFSVRWKPSEERTLLRQARESAYVIENYQRLAPTALAKMTPLEIDSLICAIRDQKDAQPGWRAFSLAEPFVRRLEYDIFNLTERKGRLWREKRTAEDEWRGIDEDIRQIGRLVSLFNRCGPRLHAADIFKADPERTAADLPAAEAAALRQRFEEYRAALVAEAEGMRQSAEAGLRRLEAVRAVREIFQRKQLYPILALGLNVGFENRWLAATLGAGQRDPREIDWNTEGYLQQLGRLFIMRLAKNARENLTPTIGIRWEESDQDTLLFKDMPPLAARQFFYQRIPAYEFLSPYGGYSRRLSSADELASIDPDLAGRLEAFIRGQLDLALSEPAVRDDLCTAAGDSRIPRPSAGSGEILTRVQDGSSIGEPQTVLPEALVIMPLIRQEAVSALKGGIFIQRMLITDRCGRAFFYNLPSLRGTPFYPQAYAFAPDGRIAYALDQGQTALKFPLPFQPSVEYLENKMLALFRCEKADLFDLYEPRWFRPLGAPKFQTAGGGMVKWYGWSGMHPLLQTAFAEAPAAAFFLPPAQPVKILFSYGISLIGANAAAPLGVGLTSAALDRRCAPQLAAEDMLHLNQRRIALLQANAVTDNLMALLDRESRRYRGDAPLTSETSTAWRDLLCRQVKSYGAAFAAYSSVLSVLADMMKAVVFYLAVLIPFAFFLQRLLFAFVRVEAQIAAFVGIFLTTYALFHLVHPAFKVAHNPQVVLVAFAMLALAIFVAFAMKGKFDYHMESFKERFLTEEAVGAIKLAGTAMLIGVNNMKRRKIRTALTCATIVCITFTMLSFTSISTRVEPTRVRKANEAPYNGIFCVDQGWRPLAPAKVDFFRLVLGEGGETLSRAFAVYNRGEEMPLMAPDEEKPYTLAGILALQMAEDGWLGPMPMASGRFFSAEDAAEVIVTDVFAESELHLPREGGGFRLPDKMTLLLNGTPLRLVGVVDSRAMLLLRDLRGEAIVPQRQVKHAVFGDTLTFTEQEEAPEGTFEPVDPHFYAIVPFGLRRHFGAEIRSVSLRFSDSQTVWERVRHLTLCAAERVYFGACQRFDIAPRSEKEGERAEPLWESPGRFYLGRGYATSIGGLASLLIPLLVSASIIFNTMLGAVYERKKEIGVFNAVGLNPIHIALFFFAEAGVYGILGGVGGYLIGQMLALAIVKFNLMPEVNLNYSSLSVVYVILFTIAIVLASAVYPALVAMRTASASSGRRRPTREGEDVMRLVFPYSFTPEMAIGVNAYLKRYFDRHADSSVGDFVAAPLAVAAAGEGENLRLSLVYEVALAPYDLGVTQQVALQTVFNPTVGAFMVEAEVERRSGQDANWIAANQPFLDKIRQYLLHWRVQSREGQEVYRQEGLRLFASKG